MLANYAINIYIQLISQLQGQGHNHQECMLWTLELTPVVQRVQKWGFFWCVYYSGWPQTNNSVLLAWCLEATTLNKPWPTDEKSTWPIPTEIISSRYCFGVDFFGLVIKGLEGLGFPSGNSVDVESSSSFFLTGRNAWSRVFAALTWPLRETPLHLASTVSVMTDLGVVGSAKALSTALATSFSLGEGVFLPLRNSLSVATEKHTTVPDLVPT